MRRICLITLTIVALLGCKKDKNTNSKFNFTVPSAVCDAPAIVDMTGAQLWGDGTPASCTQSSLQALITKGGKIKCNFGDADFTLKLTSSLTVPNKEVDIDGNSHLTIDGQNAYRIFDIQPAASQAAGTLFSIQNMNLVNGLAKLNANERGGAAIYGRAYGSLHAINVNFQNNNGPVSASDDCGAVHTIVYKDVMFANCTFINNSGANGGAVGTIGSAMSFINCQFEGNKATGTNGTFNQGGSGGAIYVDGTDQNGSPNNYITICGCSFKYNTAGYQAGAVNIVFYENKGSYASIDKTTFDQNSCAADKGGACYIMNGNLAVNNSTFSQNTSPNQGGGIWTTNAPAQIINCTFWKNKAGTNTSGLAGAVTFSKATTITNCTFAENQAGDFASAIFNSGDMTLTNNLFYKNLVGTGYQGNPYGGAVINKGTNLTVNDGNMQYPSDFTGQYGTMADYWLTSKVLTTDALLGALSNNGGSTWTMPLPENSPAIGKGTVTGAPLTDQRGTTRKNPPDIGAYEYVK